MRFSAHLTHLYTETLRTEVEMKLSLQLEHLWVFMEYLRQPWHSQE